MNEQLQNDPTEQKIGPFVSFVLLEQPVWNVEQLRADLAADWKIDFAAENISEDGTSLVFDWEGCILAASLVEAPVPDGEAERNARNNYLWRDAAAVTARHTAQILVAVLPHGSEPVLPATLMTKLVYSCCKQQGVLGIYSTGTVFEPAFYTQEAELLRQGELPLMDWVYFGLYMGEKGLCGYTYGLNAFGKTEIEVLDVQDQPMGLLNFLSNVVNYVVGYEAELHDGETIGFSEDQKLPITLSAGVALDGQTLKIAYPAE